MQAYDSRATCREADAAQSKASLETQSVQREPEAMQAQPRPKQRHQKKRKALQNTEQSTLIARQTAHLWTQAHDNADRREADAPQSTRGHTIDAAQRRRICSKNKNTAECKRNQGKYGTAS